MKSSLRRSSSKQGDNRFLQRPMAGRRRHCLSLSSHDGETVKPVPPPRLSSPNRNPSCPDEDPRRVCQLQLIKIKPCNSQKRHACRRHSRVLITGALIEEPHGSRLPLFEKAGGQAGGQAATGTRACTPLACHLYDRNVIR